MDEERGARSTLDAILLSIQNRDRLEKSNYSASFFDPSSVAAPSVWSW